MMWEVVIGLEIHTQLATDAKNFLKCFNVFWYAGKFTSVRT